MKSSITREWAHQAAKESARHEGVAVQASRPTGRTHVHHDSHVPWTCESGTRMLAVMKKRSPKASFTMWLPLPMREVLERQAARETLSLGSLVRRLLAPQVEQFSRRDGRSQDAKAAIKS